MRTKRYWSNRYDDFIKKVLGYEISLNEENARDLKEECETYLSRFLPDVQRNHQEAKKTVVFLHINHMLNLMDPIGCCYPGIIDEYSSYARKMVKRFFEEGEESVFLKNLNRDMVDMWWSTASDPNKDKEKIYKGCSDITYKLYTELLKEKENYGENFSEDKYWLKQFYFFINNILINERMKYTHRALLLKEEAGLLLDEKEKNFIEYENEIDRFICFLYVNHQLNLLDPTEQYYPGLTYPHEKFAWEIVNAYKNNDEGIFIETARDIICTMYDYLGCDHSKSQGKISSTIGKIQEQLKLLNT